MFLRPPLFIVLHDKVRTMSILRHILISLLVLSNPALGQQSEKFGPFELHYSVINSTFLSPAVAEIYGITRGKRRAVLNLVLRKPSEDGMGTAQAMQLRGQVRDLLQTQQTLDFREIRDGDAIYYIAEFRFINEEWRFFDLKFRPEGEDKTYSFDFKWQLYVE